MAGTESPAIRNDNAHFGTGAPRTDVQSRAPVVVRVDGGFDWVSAAIGAVGALGLALVVAGTAAAAVRRRHGVDPARA